MLSLLSNWKTYLLSIVLIGTITGNIVQHFKILRLESKNQVCNADLAAKNVAIQAANEMRTRQMEQIRLREQEAAKARAESLKRKEYTMHAEITGGCEGASRWMIEQAHP